MKRLLLAAMLLSPVVAPGVSITYTLNQYGQSVMQFTGPDYLPNLDLAQPNAFSIPITGLAYCMGCGYIPGSVAFSGLNFLQQGTDWLISARSIDLRGGSDTIIFSGRYSKSDLGRLGLFSDSASSIVVTSENLAPTIVPEPVSCALILCGIALLAVRRHSLP